MAPHLPEPASIDEKLAAFDSVPLFMKNLPAEDSAEGAIGALQSLIYEGTPDEIAQNFKEQGNDYFGGKRYREAIGFYTQGVDARPTDKILLEALLCNRAACNLELQNYGSVLRDCSKALELNQRSSKAYYRSALALVALKREEEALDCCDRCLSYDVDNKGVRGVRERALKAKGIKDEKEKIRQERLKEEALQKRLLKLAFSKRNLIVLDRPDQSDNPYSPHFDKEDPTNETLILPTFFLYPQYATSDVIAEFIEDTPFSMYLEEMFPPKVPAPVWDREGVYHTNQLVVYAMTHRKRLLKVGKKMTLRAVCNASKGKDGEPKDGLEVKDGCLTFVVLPKGDVETKWVEEYKANREKDTSIRW